MKIGIDIDEIITEFVKGYLDLYNKKYDGNIKFENIFIYSLWEPLGISKKEAIELADEYYFSEFFDKIGLVQGAEEGIKKLNLNYELVFITSRPPHIKEKTKLFLKKLFLDFDLNIFHSKGVVEIAKTKSEICKEQGISIFIEDDLRFALDCADKGIKVILLDKPWNQGIEHENMIRVYNWNEILEKINELNKVKERENE